MFRAGFISPARLASFTKSSRDEPLRFSRARIPPRSSCLRGAGDYPVGWVYQLLLRISRIAIFCRVGNARADQRRPGAREKQERTVMVSDLNLSGAAGNPGSGAAAAGIGWRRKLCRMGVNSRGPSCTRGYRAVAAVGVCTTGSRTPIACRKVPANSRPTIESSSISQTWQCDRLT